MKVKIKSVLKTNYNDFESFDDGQIIFRSGNTLCIKQIGKNQCQFICLNPQLSKLYSFKPSNNRKGVYTAQRVGQNIEIAHYNLKGDRKAICLSPDNSFFTEVQKIDLLVDQYDGNIIYGAARNKEGACIFLGDMGKLKILAFGYLSHFQDIKVDNRENLTLSICWNNGNTNFVKFLRYTSNQWQVQEQTFKKISNGIAIQHEILPCNRMLLATKTHLYLFQDNNLLQTIEVDQEGQIKQILKINNGLLVFCEDQKVRVFVQDSDQVTFLKKGFLKLELQQNDSIFKAVLSNNNQEVLIRTRKNNLYAWKCQNLTLEAGHFDFMFQKVQSSCSSSHDGSISISTGKRYCILTGTRNTTLWSVQKNQFVLSSQFISSIEAEKKKSIFCSAINPDGNSFILAFQDKIRLYKILFTKFKFFAEFPIKKCQNIVYSHGGQLVACKFGKGVNSSIQIINLLRLIQIGTLKIQAEATQIVWNELDDQIIVSTDQNTVQVYRVADNVRVHNIKFDEKISFVRIDYKLRKIMVSSQNKMTIIDNGTVVESITPSFEDFHYIFPLYGMYFLATKNGQLFLSQSYKFQQYTSFSLFTKSPFQMVCRNSYLIAYSSFENIMILHCQRQNHFKNKVADDIVMVQRDQILGFFEKVKKIESDYDILISATQIKLEEEKNKYQNSLQKFKQEFCREMKFLSSNFTEMSTAKLKQQKEHEKVFEKVQTQQLKYVHDIEKMYERKCVILQQKFLDLEQKNLEQKNKYQGVISELQAKYHRDVSNIRANYEKNYSEECQRAQKEQAKILQYKQKMQFKLLDLQEQNQKAIAEIQDHKDKAIQQLMDQNHALEVEVRNVNNNFEIKMQAYETLKERFQVQQKKYNKLNQHYQEALNRIKLLQSEIAQKNQMLEEKNQFITQLGEQIGGLEKAKYVLSFRTNEIRKELQPKETLVDRLKSQLQKVDEQYKQEKSKNFQLNQKNEKYTKINEVLKKQNVEAKMALKLKERVFDEMCSQLFMIVNTIDPKEWNEHLIKIYKTFIKQDKFKARQVKKKDESAQQLNRHLKHVEQSLNQVSSGNDKILKGKQKDITRRMRQNSELLYEINMMKKREKELLRTNNDLTLNNDRLQRELNEVYKSTRRESTRSQTANTGITRRVVASRDALYSRQKSMLIDAFDFSKDASMRQMQKQKSRVGSAHKTLMFKDAKRQKSAKFFDIAKQLQTARNTIKIQDQMIQELNHRLFAGEEGN